MNDDLIFVEGLRLQGKHGVSDQERETPQDFEVDISASFDTRKSSSTDDISDTLDYGRFRDIARTVVEGKSVLLMESLAEGIAHRILDDARVKDVSVTIKKLSIYTDCVPGITIRRQRT